MTATKWETPDIEAPDSDLDEFELAFPNLGLLPIITKELSGKGGGSEGTSPDDEPIIPETLAILPLRGVVVYPLTAIPLAVGQPRSVKLVDDAVGSQRVIGLITSTNPELESPGPDEIHRLGTAAAVHRLFRAPDGTIRLLVQGLARIRVVEYTETEPYLKARVELAPETTEAGLEVEALTRSVRDLFQRIAELVPSIPGELVAAVLNVEDPKALVYTIATHQRMDLDEAQRLLELDSVTAKLKELVALLTKELEVLELGKKIQTEAQTEMEKVQRDYYLREQMKAIQRELGEKDEHAVEVEEFRQKIDAAGMPEEARKEAERELDRLSKLPTAAAEYGVIRTYLDWLTTLPWNKETEDNLDVRHARVVLDEDHYGLTDVKERILEFLAVRKLRAERKDHAPSDKSTPSVDYIRREREGVILCFVGPPGVGKTSLGQSIARALCRKFIRLSLGGVRDEAEIRGFRRTYIGALPGRVVQAL